MRTEEFYSFMREREAIRLRRESGKGWPWTEDRILQSYKFTNVKRAHDRTTRELRAIYDQHQKAPVWQIFLNCGIYRYFGTSEFAAAVGWQSEWNPDHLRDTARHRSERRERVFTGAYIIPSLGIGGSKIDAVCCHILPGLADKAKALGNLARQGSWRAVIEELRTVDGFGSFMAKELVLDTFFFPKAWPTGCWDRNLWTPVGPGSRRGAHRVLHGELGICNDDQTVEVCRDLFYARHRLWDRGELELHDIQFQLCEFDKYERVRLGEGRPRSVYRRPR